MKSDDAFTPSQPLPEPKGARWWQWAVLVALFYRGPRTL